MAPFQPHTCCGETARIFINIDVYLYTDSIEIEAPLFYYYIFRIHLKLK